MKTDGNSQHPNLRRKVLWSVACGILVIGTIISVVAISPLYGHLKNEQHQHLEFSAKNRSRSIEEFLRHTQSLASQISSRSKAREALENLNAGNITLEAFQEFSKPILADAMNRSEEVASITRFDARQNPSITTGLAFDGKNYISSSIKERFSRFGPIVLDGESYLLVASSIEDNNGARIGTDLVLFKMFHLRKIFQDTSGLGKSGSCHIFSLGSHLFDKSFEGLDFKDQKKSTVETVVQAAKENKFGLFEGDCIAYSSAIDGIPWFLALVVDRNELYAPVHKTLLQVCFAILVCVLLGSWAMAFLLRPIVKNIVHMRELEDEVNRKTSALQQELTQRRQTETTLRESERRLGTLFMNLPGMAYRCRDDAQRTLLFASLGAEDLTGYRAPDLIENRKIAYGELVHPDDKNLVASIIQQALKNRKRYVIQYRIFHKKNGLKHVWESGCGVFDDEGKLLALEGFALDMSDEILLREQLIQAQKMEAVGRLAGGVAHDFNNMLLVINGYAELLMRQYAGDESLARSLKEIKTAAERSAMITKQLLAFSRKQILEPKIIDMNHEIQSSEKMLRRLIGEDINLGITLGKELSSICVDPGQLQQVILNLAVNARDAMPKGGRLLIETSNVYLDEVYVSRHKETSPGPYVMLAVSDNGEGMDSITMTKIFEPFFTTKGDNKGTGLGLATVHGIVRQSGGHIWVYSEPRKGTTFKIYFPRAVEKGVEKEEIVSPENGKNLGGSESILLVEDEAAVRNLIRETLKDMGYNVLSAKNGLEGLELGKAYSGRIHLLLTDVIMPEMSGPDMAAKLAEKHSQMAVLFMSGYTEDVVLDRGILKAGVNLIQKPFASKDLLEKIRILLDSSSILKE